MYRIVNWIICATWRTDYLLLFVLFLFLAPLSSSVTSDTTSLPPFPVIAVSVSVAPQPATIEKNLSGPLRTHTRILVPCNFVSKQRRHRTVPRFPAPFFIRFPLFEVISPISAVLR